MEWARHKTVWPHAEHSRFVRAVPHRWHVQEMGQGPHLLLLHGAGGTTHSWRDLMPILARTHRVVAIDLPGQGFTRLGTKARSGLNPMAEDIARLCAQEGWQPRALIGHSAGAAVALRLADRLSGPPDAVIGINAALEPFDGAARWLFPMMAKMLALNPLTAPVLAATMTGPGVDNLLRGTGSDIDPAGRALYRAAIGDRRHVDGTLTMMAQWRPEDLMAHLPRIGLPVLLIAGDRDRAVSPDIATRAAALLPQGTALQLEGLGHLAHEEAPDMVAAHILRFLGDRAAARVATG